MNEKAAKGLTATVWSGIVREKGPQLSDFVEQFGDLFGGELYCEDNAAIGRVRAALGARSSGLFHSLQRLRSRLEAGRSHG